MDGSAPFSNSFEIQQILWLWIVTSDRCLMCACWFTYRGTVSARLFLPGRTQHSIVSPKYKKELLANRFLCRQLHECEMCQLYCCVIKKYRRLIQFGLLQPVWHKARAIMLWSSKMWLFPIPESYFLNAAVDPPEFTLRNLLHSAYPCMIV